LTQIHLIIYIKGGKNSKLMGVKKTRKIYKKLPVKGLIIKKMLTFARG